MSTILFLSANPDGTDKLELIKECNIINQKIRSSAGGRELFKLEQRHDISIKSLIEELLNYDPKILHFSGHGSEKSALIFTNENTGQSEEVPSDALANLFKALSNKIDVVFLNACYSETQARAIAEHINCVIGMSNEIYDTTAIEFASMFYLSLGFKRSIKEAFDLAAVQIGMLSLPGPAVPQLIVKEGIDPSKLFINGKEPLQKPPPIMYPEKIVNTIKTEIQKKKINSDNVTQINNEQTKIETMKKSQTKPNLYFDNEKNLFVGRQEYINKIKYFLSEPGSRLSIVGPGGSGKTQLAFKSLHQYYENDKFIDLVIPVYFSATMSSAMVNVNDTTISSHSISFRKFLNDIGFYLIRTSHLQRTEQEFNQLFIDACRIQIYEALAKIKHPILYCDNFETLSFYIEENTKDQDAKSIVNFLNNKLPPNVSILITSRNRKNFLSEYPIILEGLKIEEGVSLFIKNASAYKDHLSDIENTKIQNLLQQIVTKTGGHPLSIEILAKTYEGGGETELENVLYTLGKEREDLAASEERLQSLQNCFDYSIDKLNSTIQNLLPLLTIFHSPFPADILEKVFQKEPKDKFLLLELYNKSLLSRIERDKEGSFTSDKFWLYTIHPALSNYLKNKYKLYITKFESELIPYFCSYYGRLLNETYYAWGKECHLDFLRQFEIISKVDDNDFDRAIEFAETHRDQSLKQIGASMAMYLGLINKNLGFYDEALEYHKKALAIHQNTNDRVGMAQDYSYMGRLYRNKGFYDEALEYHKKALAIHQNTNDRVGLALNYARIGQVYRYKGLSDKALKYHKKALAIDEQLKDRSRMTRDYTDIGVVYRFKGLYDKALEYHNKALAIDEEINDRVGMSVNYGRIGLVYSSKGFYDKSLEYLLKSLKIREELKDKVGSAKSYSEIGTIYRYKGLYDRALEYHKKALAIYEELKDRNGMALNYTTIGGTYRDKGLYDKALEYHKRALAIDEDTNDRVGMAVNYTNIGLAYENKGLYEEAIGYLRKSLAIDEELNDRVGMEVNYSRIGEVYRYKGLYDEAISYHKKALAIDEEIKNSWIMATNYSSIGVAYRYKGLYDKALEYHKKALAIHEETNDKVGMALNYFRIGEVYRCKGLYDDAISYHKKALAINEELNDKVNLPKILYTLSLIYIKKDMKKESKEAIDNAIRIIADFKKNTGYSHPFADSIRSIVKINI